MIINCNSVAYHIDAESDGETARLLEVHATVIIDLDTNRVTKNRISGNCGAIGTIDSDSLQWIRAHKDKHYYG